MQKIAIAGGSGLVGQALIPVLRAAGHEAFTLKRPYQPDDLKGVNVLINLAGENLSASHWTPSRKHLIIDSRVNTLDALREILLNSPHSVQALISASASGFYGDTTSDKIYTETDPSGTDFLADVCHQWESAADRFEELGIRVAKVRIGVVFSEKGGALPKLMVPLKFGVSVPLGSGSQWIPWIHLDDLAGIFLHLAEHPELSGTFNAAAPNPVTNRQLMKMLAKQHHRLCIPVGVPAFFLKLALGEMSTVVLNGSRISPDKLITSGFFFTHPDLSRLFNQGYF
ncbi:MAG: TIGR01777 family protein [Bacteroidetes bacterium GWF2_49_14]|nr:MAG: TIGR01777 family protein [Bacteroidetes bacterium GWF2_49_14]HBB92028.1 TIGR01777 family protein [Bacteroidales bacterium]